ncbi:MAG: hypothetical protein JXA49_07720, partial [Actinobacteria bacterium]|nr:hypothetical protein [Actinomycetota bacterium]
DMGAYEYGETARENWYLAEGCTTGGFETFVLIQNLSSADGSAALTYHTPTGRVSREREIFLPAESRVTLRVNEDQPGESGICTQLSSTVPIEAGANIYRNDEY